MLVFDAVQSQFDQFFDKIQVIGFSGVRKHRKAQQAAVEAAEEVLEHGSKTLEDVIDYVVPRARQARPNRSAAQMAA